MNSDSKKFVAGYLRNEATTEARYEMDKLTQTSDGV